MAYTNPLDYKIPGVFVGGPPQTQDLANAQYSSTEAPPAQKDYLATVQGYTDKYFDTYGQLKSFASSMAKQGVDVFQPDYSQPGGGLAFQTANKLQAALQYAANDLAETRDVNKFLRTQQAEGNILMQPGFQMGAQSNSQTNPADMFYSTNLDKQVVEANNFLNKEFYTDADAQRANQTIKEPLVQFYQQRIAQDPQNASYYQRQIAGLGEASKKTPYAAFLPKKGGSGSGFKSNEPGVAIMKRATNLKSGVWEEGSYSPTTKDGNAYLENLENSGDRAGDYVTYDKNDVPITRPKIIKRWLKDPDTGKVYWEFSDPNIPLEEVSNKPGSAVAATLMSNNAKYGDVAKMMEAAHSMGILDDRGASVDEALLDPDYKDIQDKVRGAGAPYSKTIKKVKEAVKSQLSGLKDPTWIGSNATKEFPTSNGGTFVVGKHRGKNSYYIENYKDFGFDKEPTNLSLEDVIKYLNNPNVGYTGFSLSTDKTDTSKKQEIDPDI